MATIAVGLYDSITLASQAAGDLLRNGFDRENISLVVSDADGEYARALEAAGKVGNAQTDDAMDGLVAGAGLGAAIGGLSGVVAGLGALSVPGIGPVLAAGPLAAGLAGAGVGAAAGGLLGALIDAGIPEGDAKKYADGVSRGGALLTVKLGEKNAEKALEVLDRWQPISIREIENFSVKPAEPGEQRTTSFPASQTGTPPPAWPDVANETARQSRDLQRRTPEVEETPPSVVGPSYTDIEYKDIAPAEVPPPQGVPGARGPGTDVPGVSAGLGLMGESNAESPNLAGLDDLREYEPMFHNLYEASATNSDLSFEDILPAYNYGYELASLKENHTRAWLELEPTARLEWQRRHRDRPWEEVRDSVQMAFDRIVGKR